MERRKFIGVVSFLAVLMACGPGGVLWAQASGLAPTPPMGWNSWDLYLLKINDRLIRAQAKALVDSGMKAAGYNYVVIDGGWEGYHDAVGAFRPNILKFPDMKALCDYIHSLGLKVGIHTTPGPVTCSGREGSYGHEEQDAETFAQWGIDLVKYDWCSGSTVYKADEMQAAYRKMYEALLRTHRPILYSLCQYGMEDVWKWGASVGGNMWRTTEDIADHYYLMDHIGFGQNGLEKYAGPNHWNDPDALDVGMGGMTQEEYRTQMSLWCILAAPLFASNDLTKMSPETLAMLTNREVIAVNQDPAGIQGHRVWQEGPTEIWVKPLADGSKAVGIFNRNEVPMTITMDFQDVGVQAPAKVRDLWTHQDLGTLHGTYTTPVPTHGVVMLKIYK
jgi:alpha-galactosidase